MNVSLKFIATITRIIDFSGLSDDEIMMIEYRSTLLLRNSVYGRFEITYLKARNFLIQHISIAIQRGNAASVLGSIPATDRMDEIFIRPQKTSEFNKYVDSVNPSNSDLNLIVPTSKSRASEVILNGYQGDQRSNHQEYFVCTLSNMGNTCFLNSVLYTLRFLPTFSHRLHHLIGDLTSMEEPVPRSRSTRREDVLSLDRPKDLIHKSKIHIVTKKLHELFQVLHNLEMKHSSDPYQPVALLQAVREANSIFEDYNQQDAHELLVYLFDNIRRTGDDLIQQVQQHPELLEGKKSTGPVSSFRMMWNRTRFKKIETGTEGIPVEHMNDEESTEKVDSDDVDACQGRFIDGKIGDNFVAEVFEGITSRRTKCLNCQCVTECKEPFFDIQVPVPIKDYVAELTDVHDIFRKACITTEELCGNNQYLCETCSSFNDAHRKVAFEKLPMIMIIQLKRFSTTTSGIQKVNTYLPTPLDLCCFCVKCCKMDKNEQLPHRYKLCCVIMHLGCTLDSGHYITYVKTSDPSIDYFNFPCESIDCCGLQMCKNVLAQTANDISVEEERQPENILSSSSEGEDIWLECNDQNIRPISTKEFVDLLSFKPNSSSTPYLLFYTRL